MRPLLGLVLAGWALGWVLLARRPRLPDGGEVTDVGDATGARPAPTVIVPARDESANLPGLLASLRDQGAAEVVVVDDGSTDGTADLAVELGARVVAAPPLPPGWAGKPWACHTGIEATTGERLVLLDADVRLAPGALARIAADVPAGGLLSVQPHHAVERPYEHLSVVPNLVAVLGSGIAALRPSARPGLAFGPCLATDRADLAAVGGFAAVADDALEDAALARRFEAGGRPVRCRLGADDVRFRMFPGGLRPLVQGWARTLTGGARRARPLPAIGAVVWVAGGLAAPFVGSFAPVAAIAYAVQLAVQARRIGTFRWWVGPLQWLFAVTFVGLFAWSAVQRIGRGRVRWRGRDVAVRRT